MLTKQSLQSSRAKLAEQSGKEDQITLDDLIGRVRASKQQTTDAKYRQGVDAGEKWASRFLSYEDFLRLEEILPTLGDEEWLDLAKTKGSQTIAARLLRTIDGGGLLTEDAKLNFLADVPRLSEVGIPRSQSQDLRNSVPFLRGYCDGASKIWSKIKKEI